MNYCSFFISRLLIICLVLILPTYSSSCSQSKEPVVKGKVITEFNNVQVIKVWGSHYERGFAQGFLLADKIKSIYTGYMQPLFGTYISEGLRLVEEAEVFRIDSAYHIEAQGVIDGIEYAGVFIDDFTPIHLLMSNIFLDIMGLSQMMELRDKRQSLGCSVLMNWGEATQNTSLNGEAIVTRHLDWPVHDDIVNNQVIVIHKPAEKHKQNWLMIGFAGQITVLSAINESGFAVFLNMMNNYNEKEIPLPDEAFEPLGFTLRKAIAHKDVKALSQIQDVIASQEQGYAEGFIVAGIGPMRHEKDTAGFIAELAPTPPHIVFRSLNNEDLLAGSSLYAANSSIAREPKPSDFCSRYTAVSDALKITETIAEKESWDIMRLHSNLENNIQFMQFIPHKKNSQ